MPRNGTSLKATNESSSSNSFPITSADGSEIAIPPGEFYFNTKARAKRLMLNSLSGEARQVYACLELATMGFQQELAVVMERRKQRPITNHDISKQTNIKERGVRRALAELEDEGLAYRRGTDDGPLHKGKVEIYSWAEPRPPQKEKRGSRVTAFPEWFPQSWDSLKPLIKRLRLKLPKEEAVARDPLFVERVAKCAEDLEKAEKAVVALLKSGHASDNLYKDERTERTVSQSVLSVLEVTPQDRPTDIAPEDPPPPAQVPEPPSPGGGGGQGRPGPVEVDPQYAPVFGAIPIELFDRLQDLPSPQLLATIHRNLDGAPPEALTQKIRLRWNSITTLGLLAHLAADAGNAYREVVNNLKSRQKQSETQQHRDRIHFLRECLRTLQDESLARECPEIYNEMQDQIANASPEELAEARGAP